MLSVQVAHFSMSNDVNLCKVYANHPGVMHTHHLPTSLLWLCSVLDVRNLSLSEVVLWKLLGVTGFHLQRNNKTETKKQRPCEWFAILNVRRLFLLLKDDQFVQYCHLLAIGHPLLQCSTSPLQQWKAIKHLAFCLCDKYWKQRNWDQINLKLCRLSVSEDVRRVNYSLRHPD